MIEIVQPFSIDMVTNAFHFYCIYRFILAFPIGMNAYDNIFVNGPSKYYLFWYLKCSNFRETFDQDFSYVVLIPSNLKISITHMHNFFFIDISCSNIDNILNLNEK